jgi:glycerol kinase
MRETTVLGAAILAGIVAGVWRSAEELKALMRVGRAFRPQMRAAERAKLLAGWRDAVSRTLSSRER